MKPIFNRAPLIPNTLCELSPGAIRPEDWLKKQLETQRTAMDRATEPVDEIERMRRLQAQIRLAWALDDEGLKQQCIGGLYTVMATAREDGSFGAKNVPLTEQMAALNTLRTGFLATGDKQILVLMDRFFKYLYRNLAKLPLHGDEVSRGADLIEIALWLYNITDRRYLLELSSRLRAQTLDWADVLHAFRVKNAMNRSQSYERILEGIANELKEGDVLTGTDRPFFQSLKHYANGSDVANGLKAPGIINLIKSGFKEKGGFEYGWSRLIESHGVANGMFTCDTFLNGRNPVQGVDLAAITEMMRTIEALLPLSEPQELNRMADILEKIAFNALPAAFSADMTQRQQVQQVNQVCVDRSKRAWYSLGDDASLFSSRVKNGWNGWPGFVSSMWLATDDGGLQAVSYAPCTVRAVLGGVPARIRVKGGYPFANSVYIEIGVKQPAEFPLYLRVPFWARQPMIYLPDGEILQVRANETTCVRRRWQTGDVIRLDLPTAPRLSRWYLQSASVEYGPLVMVTQPEEEWEAEEEGVSRVLTSAPWNIALVADEPMKAVFDGERTEPFHHDLGRFGVMVKAMPVDWKSTVDKEGYTRGDTGMIPMGSGSIGEAKILRLVPYGDTALRIAQFPVISRAVDEREKNRMRGI